MPKVSSVFSSKYLKADDLEGENVTFTIQDAEVVNMGQDGQVDEKIVLTFLMQDKKMVLNKTNATTIAKLYGDDTDDWIGKRVTIGVREVDFQGKATLALRVSVMKPKPIAGETSGDLH
jgi:hypothetical protein